MLLPVSKEKKVKSILNHTDNTVDEVKWPIYFGAVILVHLFYILALFGIYEANHTLLSYINSFILVFASLVLIVRFNPFYPTKLHPLDGRIFFSFGLFILSSTIFTENTIQRIETQFGKWVPPLAKILPQHAGNP